MKIKRQEFLDLLARWLEEGSPLHLAINDGLDEGGVFGVGLDCRVVEVGKKKVSFEGQGGSANIFPFVRGTKYSYTEPRPSKRWTSTIWIHWASGSQCMITEKKEAT